MKRNLIILVASVLISSPTMAQDAQEAAKELAKCLTPEQKKELQQRSMNTLVQATAPAATEFAGRYKEAQKASDQARADYIACIKTAQAADKFPIEECAALKAAFDERQAQVKNQMSAQRRDMMVAVGAGVARAMDEMRTQLPECEKKE